MDSQPMGDVLQLLDGLGFGLVIAHDDLVDFGRKGKYANDN